MTEKAEYKEAGVAVGWGVWRARVVLSFHRVLSLAGNGRNNEYEIFCHPCLNLFKDKKISK